MSPCFCTAVLQLKWRFIMSKKCSFDICWKDVKQSWFFWYWLFVALSQIAALLFEMWVFLGSAAGWNSTWQYWDCLGFQFSPNESQMWLFFLPGAPSECCPTGRQSSKNKMTERAGGWMEREKDEEKENTARSYGGKYGELLEVKIPL